MPRPLRSRTMWRALYATYVSQPPLGQASHEDTLESPLTEIGLIRPVGKAGRLPICPGTQTDAWRRRILLCGDPLLVSVLGRTNPFL